MILLPLLLAATVALELPPLESAFQFEKGKISQYNFEAIGAVLWISRVQKIDSRECRKYLEAVGKSVPTGWVDLKAQALSDEALRAFGPWEEAEDQSIQACDSLPCKVKLNGSEVNRMAQVSPEERKKIFEKLLKDRVAAYRKSEIRSEYESGDIPVNPWVQFEKSMSHLGQHVTQIKASGQAHLGLRRLDLAPGRLKLIRQIMDQRVEKDSKKQEVSVWLRDVYTDHYFESWGEWTHLRCQPSGENYLIQLILLELDLLKKKDLFSIMMRGKLKSVVKDEAIRYLNDQFSQIEKSALAD